MKRQINNTGTTSQEILANMMDNVWVENEILLG
jgi:hypothetical protein